jgi:hypothetical protein
MQMMVDTEMYDSLAQSPFRQEKEAAIVARYRTTEQFKRALGIIAPNPERQIECEYGIVYAILAVKKAILAAKRIKTYTPAEQKKDLEKRIKKLRAAESAVDDDSLIDRLTREREYKEFLLAHTLVAGKGKPQRSEIKEIAVHRARELLKFGSKEPSLYRRGAWHELAKVLFAGDDRTDLFEYLEQYRPPGPILVLTSDGRWLRGKDEPLLFLATSVGERR